MSNLNNFNIVKHAGRAVKAQLPDETWVYRTDKIFIPEYKAFLRCLDDDDLHFIYEVPHHIATPDYRGSLYMCTCGSPAIVVGMSGYVFGASPEGLVLTCQTLSMFHRHSNTGNRKWV